MINRDVNAVDSVGSAALMWRNSSKCRDLDTLEGP